MRKRRFKFNQSHHRRPRQQPRRFAMKAYPTIQNKSLSRPTAEFLDDWDMAHDLEGENAIPAGYEEFRFYAHQLA